jgi:uncharacterized membrane protein YeaQ/YmgE (transglycosylase-associated protein family)
MKNKNNVHGHKRAEKQIRIAGKLPFHRVAKHQKLQQKMPSLGPVPTPNNQNITEWGGRKMDQGAWLIFGLMAGVVTALEDNMETSSLMRNILLGMFGALLASLVGIALGIHAVTEVNIVSAAISLIGAYAGVTYGKRYISFVPVGMVKAK